MGRKKISRLAKIRRRFSLGALALIALTITGSAIAGGWWLVGRDYQECVVSEVCSIVPNERFLPETTVPGKTVNPRYLIKPINATSLTIKFEAVLIGINLTKWEIEYSPDGGNWQPYNMGDNILLSDYPDGIQLSLSGTITNLENIPNGIASVTVELYRATA